jgi:uncharacterized protein (TIGR02145 family)
MFKKMNWSTGRLWAVIGFLCATFLSACDKDDNTSNTDGTLTDADGNQYSTIQIGAQVWMAENLKTTKYNDGTPIRNVTDDNQWANLDTGDTGAWSYYDNDTANDALYGKLYNWYAVGTKKLCPKGWHIPDNEDWDALATHLGGNFVRRGTDDYIGWYEVAGGKMKATERWKRPNTGATNESGFTGLPGGMRYSGGTFSGIDSSGYWWSATEDSTTNAWERDLLYDFGDVGRDSYVKTVGLSCRCIKD